jgi:hypothetical protein
MQNCFVREVGIRRCAAKVDHSGGSLLSALPAFSSSTSLAVFVNAYLCEHVMRYRRDLPPEMRRLILENLENWDDAPWWAQLKLPMVAMVNSLYFSLWFCFLGWDDVQGMTVILERRNWAGVVARDYINSARKMLEWTHNVENYAKIRLLNVGKETTKLIIQKAFKSEYDMEIVVRAEGTWEEPLDCMWRPISAFMRSLE